MKRWTIEKWSPAQLSWPAKDQGSWCTLAYYLAILGKEIIHPQSLELKMSITFLWEFFHGGSLNYWLPYIQEEVHIQQEWERKKASGHFATTCCFLKMSCSAAQLQPPRAIVQRMRACQTRPGPLPLPPRFACWCIYSFSAQSVFCLPSEIAQCMELFVLGQAAPNINPRCVCSARDNNLTSMHYDLYNLTWLMLSCCLECRVHFFWVIAWFYSSRKRTFGVSPSRHCYDKQKFSISVRECMMSFYSLLSIEWLPLAHT